MPAPRGLSRCASGGVAAEAAKMEKRGPSAPNSARLAAASAGRSGLGVSASSCPPAAARWGC
jgi:hypothetical protein